MPLRLFGDTWQSELPLTGKTYSWMQGDSLSGPFTTIAGETADVFDPADDYPGKFIWGSVIAENENGASAEIFADNVFGPLPAGGDEPAFSMLWTPDGYNGPTRTGDWSEEAGYFSAPGSAIVMELAGTPEGYGFIIHRTPDPLDNTVAPLMEWFDAGVIWDPRVAAHINAYIDVYWGLAGGATAEAGGGLFGEHWGIFEIRWDGDEVAVRYNLGSWQATSLGSAVASWDRFRLFAWDGDPVARHFRAVGTVPALLTPDEQTWMDTFLGAQLTAARAADPDGSGGPVYPDLDPETPLMRTPLSSAAVSNHSGHSLTDAYAKTGPWPGTLTNLAEAGGVPDAFDKIVVSTIPGAPMHWRWNNDGTYPAGTRTVADAGLWDALMITEGGPPPRAHYPAHAGAMADTLDYFCRFTYNQLVNGKSGVNSQIILWSIWPELYMWANESSGYDGWRDQMTFREALDEYDRSFMFMRQYVEWKMKQVLEIPSDFRIWLSPGHRFMAEVYDDMLDGLVPGLSDPVNDMFMNLRSPNVDPLKPDGIHPTAVIGYGLACMNDAFLYGHDHASQPDPYIQPGFTDPEGVVWPAVTQAQAEYFWAKAQSILDSYGPAGRLGADYNWLHFDPSRDADPLPGWTPPT